MTSREVRQLVETEIRDAGDFAKPHGLDFARCLVEPYQAILVNTFFNIRNADTAKEHEVFWVVLEEVRGNIKHYRIVYSEEEHQFGLAINDKFIGFYGSFKETVVGM